jgi:taurine-pyruvate aminotransferase
MPGMSRVYYSNSGSEANEKAFKMIRQIAHKHHGGRKYKILYRDRDYHGTTLARCLPAASRAQRAVRPLAPDFVDGAALPRIPRQYPGCGKLRLAAADAIEEVILREGPDTVGGLCLEPITAGGGVITPPPKATGNACRRSATATISCCISTRWSAASGAPAAWFGYQHYGIKPDFVTMAKGVASGYAAISCMVTTEKRCSSSSRTIRPTRCPISATSRPSADAPPARPRRWRTCDHRGREPPRQHRSNGRRMLTNLRTLQEKHAVIGDVRGKGLFLGAELVADRASREPMDEKRVQAVVADCMAQGVIIGATNRSLPGFNNTLCFSPALIATADDIDRITDSVDQALKRVFA